jgi:hypothetical protein
MRGLARLFSTYYWATALLDCCHPYPFSLELEIKKCGNLLKPKPSKQTREKIRHKTMNIIFRAIKSIESTSIIKKLLILIRKKHHFVSRNLSEEFLMIFALT